MAMIRNSTKCQLRMIIAQVIQVQGQSSGRPSARSLQQAAALLDAAAEMLEQAEELDVLEGDHRAAAGR